VECSGKDLGKADWRAADMHRWTDWQVALTAEHQDEIRAAIFDGMASGRDIASISRSNFGLPTLGRVLEAARRNVVKGCGFVLLRGLSVDGLDREQVVRAYFGIGAHLGVARPQNRQGHLVGHVTDLGHDARNPKTRIYTTNQRQRFHVDSCDIVGLLCLRPAKCGGASAICSSTAIVAAIRRNRPDLAEVLESPFFYDRKDEIPAGKGPYYQMPIVNRHDGTTSVFFARDFIESAQIRFPDIPRLTALRVEALDMVERLAESDDFRLDMDFQVGDMQFLHNHQILHARGGYEDWPQPERRRHLLRLWLSAHDARVLPAVFEERYGPMEPGQPRGGINVPGQAPTIPLEAA
jgi:hypothetical protein